MVEAVREARMVAAMAEADVGMEVVRETEVAEAAMARSQHDSPWHVEQLATARGSCEDGTEGVLPEAAERAGAVTAGAAVAAEGRSVAMWAAF